MRSETTQRPMRRRPDSGGSLIVVDTDFPFTPTTRGQLPQHIRIGDATGKTYIFEWHTANKPPAVVESPSGVITNPPRFEFHLSNWGYFKNLTPYNPSGPVPADGSQDYKLTMGDGYLGLPGGSNSPDRFIRASVYSRDAYPGKTGADSVWTAWHVMNCFDAHVAFCEISAATASSLASSRCTSGSPIRRPQVLFPHVPEPADLRVGPDGTGSRRLRAVDR